MAHATHHYRLKRLDTDSPLLFVLFAGIVLLFSILMMFVTSYRF